MSIYPGNIYIAHIHINVEIEAEAAQFPEKEYINGIAVAVRPVYWAERPLARPGPSSTPSQLWNILLYIGLKGL